MAKTPQSKLCQLPWIDILDEQLSDLNQELFQDEKRFSMPK